MPPNRLSAFLDRKPRHSKSTSNLWTEYFEQDKSTSQSDKTLWQQHSRPKSHETLTVMQEYNFTKPLPPLPPMTQAVAPSSWASDQTRSRTAPVMHPPDELFLKMIRRRSANARLEEMRIERDQWQKNDPELAMSLAIASALPPTYLDAAPAYWTPEETERPAATPKPLSQRKEFQVEPYSDPRTQGTISKFKSDELFLEDPLKLQIDETIAQYASFRLTEATPLVSPQETATIVTPLNDIDHLYLERRKRKKKEQDE